MFRILLQSEWMLFVQKTNTLIYYIRKLPLIGKKIPSTIYRETDIKKAIGALPIFWKLIWWFVGTFLYFLLMIYYPAKGIINVSGAPISRHFLLWYLFFVLTFLSGTFLSATLMEKNTNYFVLLHIMRIPATEFYHAHMLMRSIKDSVCFLIPLFYFGFGMQSVFLVISLAFTRYIGEYFVIRSYLSAERKRKKYWWTNAWLVLAAVLFVLALAYGVPFLLPNLFCSDILCLEYTIGTVLMLVGAKCFFFVWNYPEYTVYSKKNVSLKDYAELEDLKVNVTTADIQLDEKIISSEELHTKEFESKEGYNYLNAIFFARHKRLVKRAVQSRMITIAIFGLIGTVALLFVGAEARQKAWDVMIKMMPLLTFLMYLESTGARLCKAMFFNCDISLLKYGYYRAPDAILTNFKIRLKKLLVLNLIPAVFICIFLLLYTIICGKLASILQILPIMLGVILLSIFFCLFHLFMYYITQPYTEEKTVKSPIFSTVNAIVYIACYACMKLQTGSWHFTVGIFLITLLFIPISYQCIYKFAPKTFRIR